MLVRRGQVPEVVEEQSPARRRFGGEDDSQGRLPNDPALPHDRCGTGTTTPVEEGRGTPEERPRERTALLELLDVADGNTNDDGTLASNDAS